MKRAPLLLLLTLPTLLSACAAEAPLEGAGCPCADSFVCCPGVDVCVAGGDLCPVDDWQVSSIAELTRAWLGVGAGMCAASYDKDSDGTVDARWTVRTSALGLEVELDKDGDGVPDELHEYEVDAHGQPTRWSVDQDIDRELDTQEIYERDVSGELQDILYQHGADATHSETWSYLQDGRIVVAHRNADGSVAWQRTLYRDALGRVIVEEDHQEVLTRTFGPYGPVEVQRVADPHLGRTLYAYDANGRSIDEQSFDERGVLVSEVMKTRDPLGRVVRRQLVQHDPSYGESVPPFTIDYSYDCPAP